MRRARETGPHRTSTTLPARRARDQRGAAVVDFVLVLLVLLPLVLALVQVALVLHVRNTLSSAAAEGARIAATLDGSPQAGVQTTREEIIAGVGSRYAGRISIREAMVGGAPGYVVEVRAKVPALGLGGPSVEVSVRGSAVREVP